MPGAARTGAAGHEFKTFISATCKLCRRRRRHTKMWTELFFSLSAGASNFHHFRHSARAVEWWVPSPPGPRSSPVPAPGGGNEWGRGRERDERGGAGKSGGGRLADKSLGGNCAASRRAVPDFLLYDSLATISVFFFSFLSWFFFHSC